MAEIEQQKAAERPGTVDALVLELVQAGYEFSFWYEYGCFRVQMRKGDLTILRSIGSRSAEYLRSPQEVFMMVLLDMRRQIDRGAVLPAQVGDAGE